MYPIHELDKNLLKYVDSNKFSISDNTIDSLRKLLKDNNIDKELEKEWYTPLPDTIHNYNINERVIRSLKFYKLARLYWGLDITDDMLIDRLKYILFVQQRSANYFKGDHVNPERLTDS
jgi:hypothetical protein